MWIFTRESYLSIVRDRVEPRQLHVRARREADILTLWPGAVVTATPHADYEFRASIDESDVVVRVGELLRSINYETDFKGGVAERHRHQVYLSIWATARKLAKSLT